MLLLTVNKNVTFSRKQGLSMRLMYVLILYGYCLHFPTGLLGMVPPGAMMTTQVQPTIAIQPPKPEDTIVVRI